MSTEDDADAETDADADAATPTFCEVKVGPLYFAFVVRPYWKQRMAVRFIVTLVSSHSCWLPDSRASTPF